MSNDDEALKRRYREFLDLLPLTVAIAGLSSNTSNRSLTVEQMEARAQTLGNAFKLARQVARDAIKAP
ncbi:MAG TPA: hypothetical protein VMV69_07405 [Pirellulales bacterium]|nr:hypothetical protein [Pirellulales bacterium]